uniref:Uncharacterized protein n=1 Tax=Octopus bimaculoides TaxID=37653 RepID=A0A0L8GCT1_OCTBM
MNLYDSLADNECMLLFFSHYKQHCDTIFYYHLHYLIQNLDDLSQDMLPFLHAISI